MMKNHYYYNDYENEFNIKSIFEKSYLPVNRILLDLIHYSKKDFKVAFLFSGVVLDLFELYAPEMLYSYKALADTGCVEFLSGTYSNSFGPLTCKKEYDNQVNQQKARIESIFGKVPLSFPGSDLNNFNYSLTYPAIKVLSGNRKLNDSILYTSHRKNQDDWLFRPEKMARLLNIRGNDTINLFIPYDMFGDSQYKKAGITNFLESFPVEVLSKSDYTFGLPSEKGEDFRSGLRIKDPSGIRDKNSGLFYATCNEMQIDAFEKLYSYSEKIEKCNDPSIIKDWLYLQTCDHFYFMDPFLYEESESHRMFIPYDSPYFAYINYMNILMDFSDRLEKWLGDYDKGQKGFYGKIEKTDNKKRVPISLRRIEKQMAIG
jgi:alpha-amylase